MSPALDELLARERFVGAISIKGLDRPIPAWRVRGLRGGDKLLGELPPPLFNWMGEIPYPTLQSMFDPLLPKGIQWYWRGDFVKERSDEAIDAHIVQARNAPGVLSLMHLYPIDGAVRRVGKGDTARNTRDATWSMVISGIDPNPQKAGEITRWTGLLEGCASLFG